MEPEDIEKLRIKELEDEISKLKKENNDLKDTADTLEISTGDFPKNDRHINKGEPRNTRLIPLIHHLFQKSNLREPKRKSTPQQYSSEGGWNHHSQPNSL
jgi:hypothetical protein